MELRGAPFSPRRDRFKWNTAPASLDQKHITFASTFWWIFKPTSQQLSITLSNCLGLDWRELLLPITLNSLSLSLSLSLSNTHSTIALEPKIRNRTQESCNVYYCCKEEKKQKQKQNPKRAKSVAHKTCSNLSQNIYKNKE